VYFIETMRCIRLIYMFLHLIELIYIYFLIIIMF